MWRWLVGVVVVVVAFGAGVGWSTAQQGPTLTAEDRAEIQQLHARYAQGTDFRQGDMWLSVFTDDAVFQPGTHAAEVIGMEALTEWRRQNFAARPADRQNRHWNSGWVITPTPEGAEGRLYYLGVNVTSGRPVLGGSGHYEDVYVKTADGWRIKQRRAVSDSDKHWLTSQ